MIRTPRFAWILIASFVVGLGACASVKHPPAPVTADSAADKGYLIGPGDTLSIVVWRNPEVSLSVRFVLTVKSPPLVEDIDANSKTPSTCPRSRESAFIHPGRRVGHCDDFSWAHSEQIRVVGEATKPQALPYRKNMSLLDVIIAVGGIAEFADGNRATLVSRFRQEIIQSSAE
jgi:polysaccharide export outer membrane protein